MKYPSLVPSFLCKIPVKIAFYSEGISEEGEPITIKIENLKCNYQGSAKKIYKDNMESVVRVTGTAMFNGDICPELPELTDGEVEIFGIKRKIAKGIKSRNPDGTVNYTTLELI